MIPDKFAGFDLDDVFRQEEERLKKEADDAALLEKRKALEAKRDALRKGTPPVAPIIQPAIPVSGILYQDLEFEQPAYRETGQTDKKLLTYDKSLARLRDAGFQRHARPQEAFGLLIADLEERLQGAEKDIATDMIQSYGEWLSFAFERQGDKLITYLDPEGLVWDGKKYVKNNFKRFDEQEFDIAGKASQQFIELKDVNDDLAKFIYGKSFNGLPPTMQTGNKRAGLWLPADGTIWPVGRGYLNDGYGVVGYYCRASRGVRPSAQNFSTGSKGA